MSRHATYAGARFRRLAATCGLTSLCLVAGALVPAAAVAAPAAVMTLYAAPSGTGQACVAAAPCSLSGAQAAERRDLGKPNSASITVVLADGTYRLKHGLEFGAAD